MWRDAAGTIGNTTPKLLTALSDRLNRSVQAPDVMAYVAAIIAHPGYTTKFATDLAVPGIRVPFTSDPALFERAVDLGRRVLWLHTYGQRCINPAEARPSGDPRLPDDQAPKVLAGHPIPADTEGMPDDLNYDAEEQILLVGDGRIGPVSPQVWDYTVGNKRILTQWFSSRRRSRQRPTMGGRRNSPLSQLQPDHWLTEYTSDLIDLLHVLTLLTETHPNQADLLDEIVDQGKLITVTDLTAVGVLPVPQHVRKNAGKPTTAMEIPSDPDTLFG